VARQHKLSATSSGLCSEHRPIQPNRQAGETLGALAKGLPMYQVRFHTEEKFTVTPM
jgi:hypothetical protein